MQMETNRRWGSNILLNKDFIKGKWRASCNEKGRLINQEAVTFVNIYAPNIAAPKYIKQIIHKKKRTVIQ